MVWRALYKNIYMFIKRYNKLLLYRPSLEVRTNKVPSNGVILQNDTDDAILRKVFGSITDDSEITRSSKEETSSNGTIREAGIFSFMWIYYIPSFFFGWKFRDVIGPLAWILGLSLLYLLFMLEIVGWPKSRGTKLLRWLCFRKIFSSVTISASFFIWFKKIF